MVKIAPHGRRQVLFNYNPGSSRTCGVLTDGSDMAYLISSTLAVISGICLGDSLYRHPCNAEPADPNEWKYGILLAAEEVVRAGVLSYAPGSESEHVSLVSPFIDWSRFVGFVLVFLGGLVCFVLFFLTR